MRLHICCSCAACFATIRGYARTEYSIPLRDMTRVCALSLSTLLLWSPLFAAAGAQSTAVPPAPTPWYEKIRIRGYGQVRYNRLLETNAEFRCEQCDRSLGENGGFFIRRARITFQGQVHPRV